MSNPNSVASYPLTYTLADITKMTGRAGSTLRLLVRRGDIPSVKIKNQRAGAKVIYGVQEHHIPLVKEVLSKTRQHKVGGRRKRAPARPLGDVVRHVAPPSPMPTKLGDVGDVGRKLELLAAQHEAKASAIRGAIPVVEEALLLLKGEAS